ncbi:unnamed protein product [Didymodactylos carnosus]|uniref:Uncharacterized protein n=1 Tax=Didymodactylos carnosus TaxID=1234261 RepID=A0A8S2XMA6_9BILA|nr:unnamed protein product [Didymodactylos carnosus]CAF4557012.1 unnamed protein product [Didymodactylos carnosus]
MDNHDLQLNTENTTTRMNHDNNDLRIIAGSIKTNPFLRNDGDQLYRLSTGVALLVQYKQQNSLPNDY